MSHSVEKVFTRFGPVNILLYGKGELFELIKSDFDLLPQAEIQPDLIFHLVDPSTSLEAKVTPYIRTGHGVLSSNEMVTRVKGFDLHWEKSSEDSVEVRCRPWATRKRRIVYALPSILQRFLSSRYVTAAHMQALDFVFHVFYLQVQLSLLEKKLSLIHASSMFNIEREEAILIAGWGGVGKTSLTTYGYLKGKGRWNFLADDLSILDDDGNLWFNPMGIHMYPYNLVGFEELEQKLFDTYSAIDRFHWNVRRRLLGHSSVVRRIPPRELWEVTQKASLATVITLERWSETMPRIKRIEPSLFVLKAQHVLLHELQELKKLIILANAGLQEGNVNLLPSEQTFLNKVEAVYLKALAGKETLQVLVPKQWGPKELGDYLFRELNWH